MNFAVNFFSVITVNLCDLIRYNYCPFLRGIYITGGSSFIMVGEEHNRLTDIELIGATEADQDFIANARQDIPKLINEIRRLKK